MQPKKETVTGPTNQWDRSPVRRRTPGVPNNSRIIGGVFWSISANLEMAKVVAAAARVLVSQVFTAHLFASASGGSGAAPLPSPNRDDEPPKTTSHSLPLPIPPRTPALFQKFSNRSLVAARPLLGRRRLRRGALLVKEGDGFASLQVRRRRRRRRRERQAEQRWRCED
jgi:hypothetical protein